MTTNDYETHDILLSAQEALNLLGFGPVPTTGNLDPPSVHALREFQEVAGLPPTGTIDPQTWEAILAAVPGGRLRGAERVHVDPIGDTDQWVRPMQRLFSAEGVQVRDLRLSLPLFRRLQRVGSNGSLPTAVLQPTYRDVVGDGEYRYRQFSDGRVQVLHDPQGVRNSEIYASGQVWAAITGEIGPFPNPPLPTLPVGSSGDPDIALDTPIGLTGLEDAELAVAQLLNMTGKYIFEMADSFECDPAVLAAVVQVESGGRDTGAMGRPIIRFENHIFFRRWGRSHRDLYRTFFRYASGNEPWNGHVWRGQSSDRWRAFHGNQDLEYRVLATAASLNRDAAFESVSVGLAQIMGFHASTLGYASALHMWCELGLGAKHQLDAMFRFIRARPATVRAMQRKDYTTFAAHYNGSGKKHTYGRAIRRCVGVAQRVIQRAGLGNKDVA